MDEIFKDLDFIMNECKIPLQLLCKKCERIAVLKVVIELFLEKIDFALSDGLGAYSDFLKEEVEKVISKLYCSAKQLRCYSSSWIFVSFNNLFVS